MTKQKKWKLFFLKGTLYLYFIRQNSGMEKSIIFHFAMLEQLENKFVFMLGVRYSKLFSLATGITWYDNGLSASFRCCATHSQNNLINGNIGESSVLQFLMSMWVWSNWTKLVIWNHCCALLHFSILLAVKRLKN